MRKITTHRNQSGHIDSKKAGSTEDNLFVAHQNDELQVHLQLVVLQLAPVDGVNCVGDFKALKINNNDLLPNVAKPTWSITSWQGPQ